MKREANKIWEYHWAEKKKEANANARKTKAVIV